MKKVLFELNSYHYHPDDLIQALNIHNAGKKFGEIESYPDTMYAASVLLEYADVFYDLYFDVLELSNGPFDLSDYIGDFDPKFINWSDGSSLD